MLLPLSGCASVPETATSARSKEEKANPALLSIKMGGKLKGVTDKTKLNGTLVIPARVKEIGDKAFKGCIGLTEVDFSVCIKLTEIGQFAFKNCTGLTEVSLPASLIKIGIGAFLYCKKLTKVEFLCIILTEIGEQAFRNCTGLTELDFSYTNLTEIGMWAFCNCYDLRKVTFSSSLRKIGERAFRDCNSLQKIYFLCTDLREIGKDAFPTSTTISIFATEENTDTIYNLLKQSGLSLNPTKY